MNNIMHQLSLYIRVAINHKAINYKLKPRIIFDYELLYLSKGNLLVNINGKKTVVKTGDILLIKPGKEHSFRSINEREVWMPHVHFDLLFYEDSLSVPINRKTIEKCSDKELEMIRPDILDKPTFDFPDIIRIPNHKQILSILLSLIDIYQKDEPDSSIMLKSHMLKIIHLIKKGLIAKNSPELSRHEDKLSEIASFILSNYSIQINNEMLAIKCYLSPYHFSRLFKQKYGISPAQFVLRSRMLKAKELLCYSSLSITQIAEQVGYSSIHSFSKAFKKWEGCSPISYIKVH